jgi:octaprenyl-diphosphate synthase
MAMEQILKPIEEDMKAFEQLIDSFLLNLQNERVRLNFETFFKSRGKYLRPMLLMLACGATTGDRSCFDEKLYKLALILELLHSASLVHDDIVDKDLERRGEKTVNQVFGNKIAVLAGDTLFSYAFREATMYYDKEYNVPITNLALEMCMAELIQANIVDSKETYFKVIIGKTAQFMAVACQLGARYGGGSEEKIDRFYQIGMGIGMTYQMIDDMIDHDPNAMKYIIEDDIIESYSKTMTLLSGVKESSYKDSLIILLNFIMEMKNR